MLADDYILYKFYDSRLDQTVYDQASLNRFLKNQKDDKFLFMKEQDILIEMHPLDQGIEVSLTDYDVERFDPTLAGDVDTDAPLSERTPGGLGLYLVLKMADSIHYEYHNRQSKITFTNCLQRGEEQDV